MHPFLSALGKSAKVTGYAAFLKTDGLAAFGTGLPQKAFAMIAPFGGRLILQVPFFQHPADGIGNGQNLDRPSGKWVLSFPRRASERGKPPETCGQGDRWGEQESRADLTPYHHIRGNHPERGHRYL